MAKHIYIAKQAKGLKFRVTVGDKDVTIKFENGQYSTDDDELAQAIDDVMKISTIGRFCQKADKAAALQMAAQHQAMLKRTGAFKGGVTASAIKDAGDAEKQRRDKELLASGSNLKDQFAEDENLVLTDEGHTEASPGLQLGGDPTANVPVGEQKPDAEPTDEGNLATEVVKPEVGGLKLGK